MKFSIFLSALLACFTVEHAMASDCVDTGVLDDGWGWNGAESCKIPVTASECVDYDGDGWGWDGIASCRTDDQTLDISHTGQLSSYRVGDDGYWQPVQFSTARFTDNGDGTFNDLLTGLTWLGVRDCIIEQSWGAAIDSVNQLSSDSGMCNSLADGSGSGDWRLPNINELKSLIDYSKHSPVFAAGIPFSGTWDSFPWRQYWSSTSFAADPAANSWVLNADFGQIAVLNKANVARTFAVRD